MIPVATTHAVVTAPAAEIVPGRLYALGGTVPVDGRISWLPPSAKGHESLNAYLLLGDEHAVLVDTGVAHHRDLVLAQLHELLPAGRPLAVFLTRAEADCLTNLDAIVKAFAITEVYAGGVHNPFDFFDEILDQAARDELLQSYALQVVRKEPGERITLGPDRELVILGAPVRLLTTFWAYDTGTGAMFTSDSFGHLQCRDPQARVLDEASPGAPPDGLREWLLTKFDWFVGADTAPVRSQLTAIFGAHDTQILAPVHGRVIHGEAIVRAQVERLDQVLADVGAA